MSTLTPEQSQKITDLRRRMYTNVQEGRESHFGLTENEVREALDAVRSSRAQAMAAGEAKKTRAKKKLSSQSKSALFAKFAKHNLD